MSAIGLNMKRIAIPIALAGGILGFRSYCRGPMYKGDGRIDGKTVLITGGNAGCGLETAKELAKRGGRIAILCRDLKKASAAAELIKEETGVEISYYQIDLSSLESVQKCAAEISKKEPKVDILINNAGIMACPRWETKDGFEMQFGTNHLGHFLLTILLLDNIKAAAPSRIINLSSIAHEYGEMNWDDLNYKQNYTPTKAYCQSKLANILFTKSLAKMFKDDGITSYAVHPGSVATDLNRHLGDSYGSVISSIYAKIGPIFQKTPVLGAQTTIYCAVEPQEANQSGNYYWDNKQRKPMAKALEPDSPDRLWQLSMEMVKKFIPASNEKSIAAYTKRTEIRSS